MEPIKKTIVYDKDRKPVQVVISYEDWLRIEPLLRTEPNVEILRRLYGRISWKGDPVEIQRKMRDEWPD